MPIGIVLLSVGIILGWGASHVLRHTITVALFPRARRRWGRWLIDTVR